MKPDLTTADKPYVAVRSEKELAVLRAEMCEDPNTRNQTVADFRVWVKAQPHFTIRTDDFFLLLVLRLAKWDVGAARHIIERFCMYQTQQPYRAWMVLSSAEVSDHVREIQKLHFGFILPKRNPADGCRITLIRWGYIDWQKYTRDESLQYMDWFLKVRNLDFTTAMNGSISIWDFKNCSLSFLKACTPAYLKMWSNYLHEAMPHRVKEQHMLNLPTVFRALIEVYKSFCSDKIKKRIFAYGSDTSSLLRHVDASCLPEEYGGSAGSLQDINEDNRRHLEANIGELDKYTGISYDESLKPSAEAGTYRKIQCD